MTQVKKAAFFASLSLDATKAALQEQLDTVPSTSGVSKLRDQLKAEKERVKSSSGAPAVSRSGPMIS